MVVIRVGIVGAAGYAGGELMRLLLGHEGVLLTNLVSRTHAGKSVSQVYPGYYGYDLPHFQELSADELADGCDVVFLASPSGTAWPLIKELISVNPDMKIIDIGSDLRLKDPLLYREWYGYTHGAPELLSESVYGLTELHAKEISDARLVANPGCYPTATILAFAPLVRFGLVSTNSIIVNALSGVSGAGRTLGQGYHFPECNENMRAYGLLRHRHIPEIEQELAASARAGGHDEVVSLNFTPHLVPLNRGILMTGYADLRYDSEGDSVFTCANQGAGIDQDPGINCDPCITHVPGVNLDAWGLTEVYKSFYHGKKFIRILPPDQIPQTKAVAGSNYCDISVRVDGRTGRVLVMSAIDNLVKGAAGQAIQNMNLMFGEPEDRGLNLAPIWP
jgi:N-acetyl-gamma-glutamyl-phosphate reductase